MTADTGFRARHATSFERVAVVSDEDWIRPALSALSFLLPGKAKGFRVRELAAAKAWLAEGFEGSGQAVDRHGLPGRHGRSPGPCIARFDRGTARAGESHSRRPAPNFVTHDLSGTPLG